MVSFDIWHIAINNRDIETSPTISIILAISTIIIFFFFLWKTQKSKAPPLPPGPWGLPLVGYLPFLGTFLYKDFTKLAGVYGPLFKLRLGCKLCLVVSSPAMIKEVVRDKDTIFANRDPPIAGSVITYGANDIVWSSWSPQWKKLRKIFVREVLGNASLDASNFLRKEEVRKAIKDVYDSVGNPINISNFSYKTVTNILLHMFWGSHSAGEASFDLANFRELASKIMVLQGRPNVSDLFPALAWFDLQGIEGEIKRILQCFDQIFESVIKQRLGSVVVGGETKKKDFLQILLDLYVHGDDAKSVTRDQLKALLMDMMVGGTDTTSTMIEWTMAELIKHPHIMKKVCQELDEVVGLNTTVEETHLPKLHYLDAVVKEAFRLHAPIPLLVPRLTSQTCTLGGYTIPKGTTVFLNVYALHRDPSLWESPSEFRPERFLMKNHENNNNKGDVFDYLGNNFQYLPFGSGRRICAGVPSAEKMLMFVLASLLHSFKWDLPPNTELEMTDKFGIIVRIMKPLVAIPTPRLSNLQLY